MSYRYEGNGNFSTDAERRAQSQQAQKNQAKKTQSAPKKESTSSSKPSNSDMGSWIFIAVMFAVAWPIGLILLISKLSEDGKSAKKAAPKKKQQTKSTVKSAVSGVTRSPNDSVGTARVLKIVGIALAAIGALAALGTLSDLPYALEYGYLLSLMEDLFISAGLDRKSVV